MGTPNPSARARATRGVCSMIELSSSPRSTPLAKPCPSCIRAACAACADAPLMLTALDMDSVTVSICCCVRPSDSLARDMLAKVVPNSTKPTRLRCAISNRA